jgi:hypothetical protein
VAVLSAITMAAAAFTLVAAAYLLHRESIVRRAG